MLKYTIYIAIALCANALDICDFQGLSISFILLEVCLFAENSNKFWR